MRSTDGVTKCCSKCHEVKPLEEFGSDRSRLGGLQNECKACRGAIQRAYRATHPAKQLESSRRAYRANSEKRLAEARASRVAHPEVYHLRDIQQRARAQGTPFTLTLANLPPLPATCPALGITLQRGNDTPHAVSPSIDRLIPALGYVPSNVAWLSNRANTIKWAYTPAELAARAAADPLNTDLAKVAAWVAGRVADLARLATPAAA